MTGETPQPSSDFDPKVIAKSVSKHDGELIEVNTRIGKIEASIGTPEGVANMLEKATEDSKKLDKLFASIFCSMLKNESTVKNAIYGFIRKDDRNEAMKVVKRFGTALGWLASIIVTAVVSVIITKATG